MARKMVCLHCGNEGEIEVPGLKGNGALVNLFRHLGHNPFSGHMHYQCPSCEIVLLVDPMTVLKFINNYALNSTAEPAGRTPEQH